MPTDTALRLAAGAAILFQTVLLVHFAVRRWAMPVALRWGWIVYALSIPVAALSVLLRRWGLAWPLWAGGLLYLVWSVLGYTVEYVLRIPWRSPPRWPILVPYLLLYLATAMFYWWPFAAVSRRLWLLLGALFVISSALNLASHRLRTSAST